VTDAAPTDRAVAPRAKRRPQPRPAPSLALALALAVAAMPACNAQRAPVDPPVTLPGAFSATGDDPVPDRWWTSFADPTLDALLEEALCGNFTLRVAWDRLDQARAVAARSGAPLWPSLDATFGAARSVTRAELPGDDDGEPAAATTYATDYALGLAATYEIDLWGRVRSTHDAARLDLSATRQDLQAAAITLAADIAATWFRLIEQRAQLDLVQKQIETNQKHLQVIALRFRSGQVGATDVLQQQQLVESTRGDRVLIESAVDVLEHQLAVLVGRTPGDLRLDVPPHLPQAPPFPQTGLPAEWIRRRPDVQAAEIRIRAADQRVAAAVADQFPRLSLTVDASTSAERLQYLFDNWMAGIAANLVAPLFDGGERRAEVRRTRAVVAEQLNAYGQVVLNSLQEVEDAIAQETRQAEYVASLQKQLDLSGKASNRTLENYTKGTADFVRYLTALLSHHQLQRNCLQARRDLVLFRIDLYRALAGGWDLPRPTQAAMRSQE